MGWSRYLEWCWLGICVVISSWFYGPRTGHMEGTFSKYHPQLNLPTQDIVKVDYSNMFKRYVVWGGWMAVAYIIQCCFALKQLQQLWFLEPVSRAKGSLWQCSKKLLLQLVFGSCENGLALRKALVLVKCNLDGLGWMEVDGLWWENCIGSGDESTHYLYFVVCCIYCNLQDNFFRLALMFFQRFWHVWGSDGNT